MSRNQWIWIFMFLLAIPVSRSDAGEFSYKCSVKNVYELDDAGKLRPSNFEKTWRGSSFEVSKKNGEIIGDLLPTNQTGVSTVVVNRGSSEMSFKSYAIWSGKYPQIQIIEIQEFINGAEKPFVASSMGGAGVVTGICR